MVWCIYHSNFRYWWSLDHCRSCFDDNIFSLVVFDPPHLLKVGKKSWMAKKYGALDADTWRDDLRKGFSECMRVVKNNGVIVFKCSDRDISHKDILNIIGHRPLLGDRRGKTRWYVFVKDFKEEEND